MLLVLFVSHTLTESYFCSPPYPALCPGLSSSLVVQLPLLRGCLFPFPQSWESINPEPLPASGLMNSLCLVCPELIAHKLQPVGTQGLFVPARITCPPRSLRPRPAVPEGHPADMHCQSDPCAMAWVGWGRWLQGESWNRELRHCWSLLGQAH